MPKPLEDIARIALLEEPTRLRLFEYVRSRDEPVGRDEGAKAAGISRGLAAFHLDRLAEAGLLEVEYRRISGRSGRGAGRPAKLYRASSARINVSLPPTRYDLAGAVLIEYLNVRAGPAEDGREAIREIAGARGRALGRDLGKGAGSGSGLARAERALDELGFQPHRARDVLRFRNCPFHVLAEQSPDLVCALNQALVSGVLEGLECRGLVAEFDPEPGACCVRVRTEGRARPKDGPASTPRGGPRRSAGLSPPS